MLAQLRQCVTKLKEEIVAVSEEPDRLRTEVCMLRTAMHVSEVLAHLPIHTQQYVIHKCCKLCTHTPSSLNLLTESALKFYLKFTWPETNATPMGLSHMLPHFQVQVQKHSHSQLKTHQHFHSIHAHALTSFFLHASTFRITSHAPSLTDM